MFRLTISIEAIETDRGAKQLQLINCEHSKKEMPFLYSMNANLEQVQFQIDEISKTQGTSFRRTQMERCSFHTPCMSNNAPPSKTVPVKK